MGHLFSAAFDFGTLKDGPARRKTAPWPLYYRSKLVCLIDLLVYSSSLIDCTVLYATELGRRYGDQGIVSMSVAILPIYFPT
jgi:hypothetical protein